MKSALPGTPLVWSPKGASDTLDASTAPAGAMTSLQNLIPDPTTKNLWQCRPAGISIANFTTGGFNTPTFISCWKVVGSRVYGMVSTARYPGHDEPFVYDLVAQAFVAITGVTALNTPVSPETTGAWTPPNLDLIGVDFTVAHPGFDGANGYFGVLNIANSSAPTWTSQNTTGTALVDPPSWVVNFNGRCFYLVNPPSGGQPAAYMSDPLNATQITNANQILTFYDNSPLTCAVGLPLNNQLGGVFQSLMVFKGVQNIYQVTDFNANVGDPIGNNGEGISTPFINALVPSRMCASYNVGVYRVQVQNGVAIGNPQQWWYDTVRQLWSGPHTQAASLMAAYAGTFLVTIQGAGAIVFQSDPVQSSSSTFVENGTQMQGAFL